MAWCKSTDVLARDEDSVPSTQSDADCNSNCRGSDLSSLTSEATRYAHDAHTFTQANTQANKLSINISEGKQIINYSLFSLHTLSLYIYF